MPPGAVAEVVVRRGSAAGSLAAGGVGSVAVVSAGVWAKAAPVMSATAPAAIRSVFIGEVLSRLGMGIWTRQLKPFAPAKVAPDHGFVIARKP